MKKLLLLCMLIATVLLTVPCGLYAQEEFPDDPGETDTAVPFDGGTSLLIIAGIAYGIKNRFDEKIKRKKNKEEI